MLFMLGLILLIPKRTRKIGKYTLIVALAIYTIGYIITAVASLK